MQNFGLEFSTDVLFPELQKLYIEKCFNERNIFCGEDYSLVKFNDGRIFMCGKERLFLSDYKRGVSLLKEIKELPSTISKISFGECHVIILLCDGRIMSRGNNTCGQLGHGDRIHRTMFEEIKTLSGKVSDIACCQSYTMIKLFNGMIFSCGENFTGQLWQGDIVNRVTFEEIRGLPFTVSEIICGSCHVIIRLTNGVIMSYGNTDYGQLGNDDTICSTVFKEIRGLPKNISEIVCGYNNTFIRLTDGRIFCCGDNEYGQLGQGDTNDKYMFEEIKGIPRNISRVVCGLTYTFLLSEDGKLMSCGANSYGQLGQGHVNVMTSFNEILEAVDNVCEVVCGSLHTLIRTGDGRILSCGDNRYGQLGHGDKIKRRSFKKIKI